MVTGAPAFEGRWDLEEGVRLVLVEKNRKVL